MAADRRTRLFRLREALGALPVLWACFHLWEQWPAFRGREPFVERLARTSHGSAALFAELLLGVLPAIGWIGIDLRLRLGGPEPAELRLAMAEDPELARRLGLLARAASWVFFGWLLYHVAWLWLPKLVEGSDPLRTWLRLRDGMGLWAHAIAHAIGLTAFTVHLWATGPRLAVAFGAETSPPNRRAIRLSGAIVALGLLVLYAQLTGWHAAGAGTVWGLD